MRGLDRASRLLLANDAWNESDHPRGEGGKFGSGSGGPARHQLQSSPKRTNPSGIAPKPLNALYEKHQAELMPLLDQRGKHPFGSPAYHAFHQKNVVPVLKRQEAEYSALRDNLKKGRLTSTTGKKP